MKLPLGLEVPPAKVVVTTAVISAITIIAFEPVKALFYKLIGRGA